MKHPILISLLLMLPAWLPVRADELTSADFPLSDERMAACIELAADGKLTIPKMADRPDLAGEQHRFLSEIRMTALREISPDSSPAGGLYRAIMAARAGDYGAASILLEWSLAANHDHCRGYCLLFYRRWNGTALSYRFLHWWSDYISGSGPVAGVVTLLCAAQLVAMPLLIKLRRGIMAGRPSRMLIWPALAVAFAEFVPVFWAASSGSAWAFAYDVTPTDIPFAVLLTHLAVVAVFVICSRGVMSPGWRAGLAVSFLLLGSSVTALPFVFLRAYGLVGPTGAIVGIIFYSTSLAVLLYFLLLFGRERSSRPAT